MNDAELIERLASQDREAFAALLRRHHDRGFQLAWRVLGDRQEAEDIMQEVFLRLWQAPHKYDAAKGQFSAWLNRVTINAALDRRRRIKPVEDIDVAAAIPSPDQRADEVAESNEAMRLVQSLPDRQRAVISLFYVEGHSMNEIAQMLETSEAAVESLLSRGRAALRAMVVPAKDVA